MPERKFLEQIADYYIEKNEDLSNLTFVFPNRRSALFMRKYLQNSMKHTGFLPRMMSITFFTQQYNNTSLATPNELIFILYKVYCTVLTKHNKTDQIPDFDNFYFWGSILLNDFNDVDGSLADASDLFTNIKNIKQLKAHYLTSAQKQVIEYIWGEKFTKEEDDIFWEHVRHSDNKKEESASNKFLNLWEIMYELYTDFRKVLSEQNPPLAYSGMQSRYAWEKIKGMGKEDFKGKRFAFIGFNVLSLSRINIFKRFKDLGIADFFWDIASPYLTTSDGTPTAAGQQILPLSKKFAQPSDFHLLASEHHPDIEIISVPSNIGQTKIASEIIEGWSKEWVGSPTDAKAYDQHLINTAIVMADENLLMPMLYSVPQNIQTINITMSVSYRTTPFAALMAAIISMHLRAYKIKDSYHYYYQDVMGVVSHPHITRIAQKSAEDIKERIIKEHIFNIDAEMLVSEYPDLAFIFKPITEDRDIDSIKVYIDGLVMNLTEKLRQTIGKKTQQTFYELEILKGYADEANILCNLLKKYNIGLREHTFLQMIERTLQNKPISFSGEPLKGMQIMGVMDTRTLDFENLIFMSLNERTFPKRSHSPSLISMNLRSYFGLPTQEHEESSYAYQFYRLISRAKHVRLLYDSRTSGISSGEKSRYLSQLLHLTKEQPVSQKCVDMRINVKEPEVLFIKKTPKVMEELRGFLPGGRLRFSASAFKVYFQCPLRFYLEYVRNLRIFEETVDYIDAASYGTVTHRVIQELFRPYSSASQKSAPQITAPLIDSMIKSDIESLAMHILNKEYYHDRFSGRMDKMPGEGKVISMLIAKYVRKMLEIEKEWAQMSPFTFIANELYEKETFEWQISDKYKINFKMSIDRVDCTNNSSVEEEMELRFIDFKTGDDDLSCKDADTLFSNHKKSAIFQLLLYCYAYADLNDYKGKIRPMIYKLQTIATEGIKPIKIGREEICDYRQADAFGFMDIFREKVEEIFNPDTPFVQTKNIDNCKYCPFKQLCGRYPEEIGI